jgi:hypothetical protein
MLVLIAEDIGYRGHNLKGFFKYFELTEEDPNQSEDIDQWDKY